jgi:hypothetical protein
MRTGSAQWSLDALTEAAHDAGIQVERELRSGVSTCARACVGAAPTVGEAAMTKTLSAMRTAVVTHYTEPPAGSTTVCTDELGPVTPRTFAPAPGWSPTGHRYRPRWSTAAGMTRCESTGRYGCATAKS